MGTERTKGPDESFCTTCREVIKAMAELCPTPDVEATVAARSPMGD